MDIFASSPIIIFLLGQLTLTYSDVSDCKMKRQGYASDSNAMSIGFTFEVDDVSSSIECATLSLQHSNSTVGFLYEKLASVCRGIGSVLEPSNDEAVDIEYYILICREAEVSKKQEPPESYLGCYQDDIPRDLSGPHVPFPSDNTPEKCIMICQMSGYLYAAVQFEKECFCGNSYGKYGSLPEVECSVPCPGDASVMCGGEWTNSVYTTVTNE